MITVQIAGRLGKDAESRFTPSGQKLTTFTVAANIRKGGKEETTVWWRIVIWGDRFDRIMSYLKKGSAVIVVGEMNKADIWTDKEGKPQLSLELTAEIIRFNPFGSSDRSAQEQGAAAPQSFAEANLGTASYGNASSYGMDGSFAQQSQAEEPLPF